MSQPSSPNHIDWKDVPKEACRLAKAAAGTYQVISDLLPSLPEVGAHVWYNPDSEKIMFSYPIGTDSEKVASWYIALRQVPNITAIEHGYISLPNATEPYIHVKKALDNSTLFGPLASIAQFKPNVLNRLWGGPNPLSATIGGGLLGAGLGYGGGWLAEQFLPEDKFEKGKLRRSLAILGGIGGAAPGLWAGFDRQFRGPAAMRNWSSWIRPLPTTENEVQASDNRFAHIKKGMAKLFPEESRDLNEDWVKSAQLAGGAFLPVIPVDQFGRAIWDDLRGQGGFTSPQLAAATSGLVEAAGMSRGTNYVSPMDIVRIGMGMGSGYVSGLIVGKALGALAGLRPSAQRALQQTGVWAGMLANTVPLVFRS